MHMKMERSFSVAFSLQSVCQTFVINVPLYTAHPHICTSKQTHILGERLTKWLTRVLYRRLYNQKLFVFLLFFFLKKEGERMRDSQKKSEHEKKKRKLKKKSRELQEQYYNIIRSNALHLETLATKRYDVILIITHEVTALSIKYCSQCSALGYRIMRHESEKI